ncbi:BlaI/MecI/CopY family transcriptional regulator [Streptomyces tropicalis]|uniref:BlaI/MecI/CopY family transcriptional regulator n=1 Tax=Streptomyces tropicalis TaxID=3034234 RepID=A0ABT6A601_9ACTN|nr:BlaI/MecI/CopY family transcriptional regulator [Streptomyces tropicalis]MDF3300071.1 BlaI/MecI/CopY family transcriptional regulator [Streptomyces tropicalis]
MSETTAPTTELTSQYITQVTGDLERNVKEQERVGAEIVALQEQLTALQRDHAVLVNVHQALRLAPAPAKPTDPSPSATVPAPRTKAAAKSGTRKRSQAKNPSGTTDRSASRKRGPGKPSAPATTARPTLVHLVREHLAEQSEPRSVAEIAETLQQTHPDRGIQTTPVRTTLENLVAKSLAQRSKQGSSVFYTASSSAEATAASGEARPEASS